MSTAVATRMQVAEDYDAMMPHPQPAHFLTIAAPSGSTPLRIVAVHVHMLALACQSEDAEYARVLRELANLGCARAALLRVRREGLSGPSADAVLAGIPDEAETAEAEAAHRFAAETRAAEREAGELFDELADREDLADQCDAARAHWDAEQVGPA